MAQPIYQRDPDGNEIYPKDLSGNEILGPHQQYAVHHDGEPYYPTNINGHQYVHPQLKHIFWNGEYKLPLDQSGRPQYPTANGEEHYFTADERPVYGRGGDGQQYYARDKFGDEFYPPVIATLENDLYLHGMGSKSLDPTWFAKMADGTLKYAQTTGKKTVFPKDADLNEFYLMRVDLAISETVPTRYARTRDGDEFYPKRLDAHGVEHDVVLPMGYARDRHRHPFYPIDAFHNEFYASTAKEQRPARSVKNILRARYAVTTDLKIIVPRINGLPHYDPSVSPALSDTDLLGRIVREGDDPSDYLSSKTYASVSRPWARVTRNYRYVDTQGRFVNVTKPPVPLPAPKAPPSPKPAPALKAQPSPKAQKAARGIGGYVLWIVLLMLLGLAALTLRTVVVVVYQKPSFTV